jgi:putative restriction endonuclease
MYASACRMRSGGAVPPSAALGYKIWQFTLRRRDAVQPPRGVGPTPPKPAPRAQTTILRIIRNTVQAKTVKELHGYRCQFCDLRLQMPTEFYAEGAHIKPLGAPHWGPDTVDNILCLSPNHHLLFDVGAVTIADDLSLIGMPCKVRTSPKHPINLEYVRYHRAHYAPSE